MTKAEMMKLFPNFSPRRAFKVFEANGDETGYELFGKHVRVSVDDDGVWDVYICNAKDMAAGLTQHRTNALARLAPKGHEVTILDRECWWRSQDLSLVRAWLEVHRGRLGISKRRTVPENARSAFLARTQRPPERDIGAHP